jgi:hypothetical protein
VLQSRGHRARPPLGFQSPRRPIYSLVGDAGVASTGVWFAGGGGVTSAGFSLVGDAGVASTGVSYVPGSSGSLEDEGAGCGSDAVMASPLNIRRIGNAPRHGDYPHKCPPNHGVSTREPDQSRSLYSSRALESGSPRRMSADGCNVDTAERISAGSGWVQLSAAELQERRLRGPYMPVIVCISGSR